MLFTKVVFKDKVIKDERLELADKNSLYFFGPNVELSHSTIVLKVAARNLSIRQGTRFVDCSFEVKQELKNHQQWIYASLKGCRFKGRFFGCDFGHWPSYTHDAKDGAIEDCDFTEARLDACRFMGCDPATLRLPRWPCFTFLDPIGRAAELRDAGWPDLFRSVIVDELDTQPAPTRAVTYHAPSVAHRLETTEDALRAVIEKLERVVF